MANIKRITASDEAIENAKKSAFTAGYGFSDGQILIIEKFDFTSHSVDGVNKDTAVPVIFLKGSEEVIYLRSFLKQRFDYQNKLQKTTGTFNKEIEKFTGKPLGEIVDELNKTYKGKSLKAIRKTYSGVDRNGDVRSISYNEYDLTV